MDKKTEKSTKLGASLRESEILLKIRKYAKISVK